MFTLVSSNSWSSFAPVKANGKGWEAAVGVGKRAGKMGRVHKALENTLESHRALGGGDGMSSLPREGPQSSYFPHSSLWHSAQHPVEVREQWKTIVHP